MILQLCSCLLYAAERNMLEIAKLFVSIFVTLLCMISHCGVLYVTMHSKGLDDDSGELWSGIVVPVRRRPTRAVRISVERRRHID